MIAKLLLSSIAALGMIGTAAAADLPTTKGPPVYVPPPPPPLMLTWTGFYIGATAGYGFTDSNISIPRTQVPHTPSVPAPDAFDTNASGFIGGGELGYNYQTGPFVIGIEADFSGAAIRGSNTSVVPFGVGSQRLNFLGTVRPRVGYAPINSLLIYATGGFAYGSVSSNTNLDNIVYGSSSSVRPGFAVGGGVEWMFMPNWSLKAEYLWFNLKNQIYSDVGGRGAGALSTDDFEGNIVRAGVNYKFDLFAPPTPVVAKY